MLEESTAMLRLQAGVEVIARHRGLVITLFLLTVIPVAVATFTAAQQFRATAKVLVRREEKPGALNPYFSRLNQEEDIRSELEIATCRPVLENVLREALASQRPFHGLPPESAQALQAMSHGRQRLVAAADGTRSEAHAAAWQAGDDLMEPALERMRRRITVEAVTGANVITISFEDTEAERAAWYANALANAYATYNAQVHGGAEIEDFLSEHIGSARARLDSLEQALYAFRMSSGLVDYDKQVAIVLEKYRSTDYEILRLREEAEMLTAKITRLRRLHATRDSLIVPDADMDAHPAIRQLYSRLTDLRLEYRAALGKYTRYHRHMRDLASQIAGVQKELVSEIDRLIGLEEERRRSLQEQIAVMSRKVVNVKADLQNLPAKERVLSELELATENTRKIYSLLVTRREEMSVEKAADRRLSRIAIISPAGVPFEPISPRKGRNLAMGFLLGLLAGVAGALVREHVGRALGGTPLQAHPARAAERVRVATTAAAWQPPVMPATVVLPPARVKHVTPIEELLEDLTSAAAAQMTEAAVDLRLQTEVLHRPRAADRQTNDTRANGAVTNGKAAKGAAKNGLAGRGFHASAPPAAVALQARPALPPGAAVKPERAAAPVALRAKNPAPMHF